MKMLSPFGSAEGLSASAVAREKRYHRYQLLLAVLEFLIGVAFLLILLLSGFTLQLEAWIRSSVSNPYVVFLAFVGILGVAESVLLFPLNFLSGYLLEHRFGLSNQTLGAWFWEKTKALLVAAPIGLVLMLIFFALLRRYPQNWWFVMGSVMVLFSILLARLSPILIMPLFYRSIPIKDQALAQRVEALCAQVGMRLEGVYQFDLSKNTKKANAAFTGLGRSRRVILGDTLIERLELDEILIVLAHELGHYKLKHIWKSIGLGIVVTYLGLFLVARAHAGLYPQLGFQSASQIAGLPLIALLLTLYQLITGPLMNIYSRANERAADDFAIRLMGNAGPFRRGLAKISTQNLADPSPNPVVEFLFYSHPSIAKRLARLGA